MSVAIDAVFDLDASAALALVDDLAAALESATAGFADGLAAALESVQGQEVTVDVAVDDGQAVSELESIDANAPAVEVEVDADTSTAEADIDSIDPAPVDVPVEVDTSSAETSIDGLGSSVEGVGGSLSSTVGIGGAFGDLLNNITESAGVSASALGGLAIGVAGFTAIVETEVQVLQTVVEAAGEAQAAQALFKVALDNSGASAFAGTSQFQNLASEIQSYSGFSDEAILTGERLLISTSGLSTQQFVLGGNFERTTRLAADLARFAGTDVVSAMQRLGRGLVDPAKGARILGRLVGGLSASQREYIQTVQDTQGVEAAQSALLDIIQGKVRGTADAYGSTLAGQLDITRQHLDEVAESLGVKLLPFLTRFLELGSEFISANVRIASAIGHVNHEILQIPTDPIGALRDLLGQTSEPVGGGIAGALDAAGTAAETAAQQTEDAQAAIDSLVQSATANLPTLGDAIGNVNKAGEAFGVLNASTNPDLVINNLFEMVASFEDFTSNLAELPPIVQDALAPLGPAVAGPFAAALATAPQATRDALVRVLQEAQAAGIDITQVLTGVGTSGIQGIGTGISAGTPAATGAADAAGKVTAGAFELSFATVTALSTAQMILAGAAILGNAPIGPASLAARITAARWNAGLVLLRVYAALQMQSAAFSISANSGVTSSAAFSAGQSAGRAFGSGFSLGLNSALGQITSQAAAAGTAAQAAAVQAAGGKAPGESGVRGVSTSGFAAAGTSPVGTSGAVGDNVVINVSPGAVSVGVAPGTGTAETRAHAKAAMEGAIDGAREKARTRMASRRN